MSVYPPHTDKPNFNITTVFRTFRVIATGHLPEYLYPEFI